MADPITWKDDNGSVRELRAGFYLRQPSSTSHAERENAARHSCAAEGRRMIEEWNRAPLPMKFEFYDVKLIGMEGVTTKTEKNPWTGVRHHECKGTGVAHLLYTIKGNASSPLSFQGSEDDSLASNGDDDGGAWSAPETWKVQACA